MRTMIKLIPERSIRTGAGKYMAQLIADSPDELAGVTAVDGIDLDFGSLAFCGRDGEVCSLMSNGKWYKVSDGSEVTGA